MGNPNDGTPSKAAVAEAAKKAAADLAAHPEKLPSPLDQAVAGAEKLPGKIADGVKKDLTGPDAPAKPGGPGDSHKGADVHKPPGAAHVDVKPDLNPSVKLDHGKPSVAGSSAGVDVTVAGKKDGVQLSATAKAAGGLNDQNKPQEKGGLEASATVTGNHYTVTGKLEGNQTVDKGQNGGVHATEHGSASIEGGVDVTKGARLSGKVQGGIDAEQNGTHGNHVTPSVSGTLNLTITPGAGASPAPRAPSTGKVFDPEADMRKSSDDMMKRIQDDQRKREDAMADRMHLKPNAPNFTLPGQAPNVLPPLDKLPAPVSPGQQLSAKIQHDQYLAKNADSPAERTLAANRAAAEEQVLKKHPEFGTPTAKIESYGLKPDDYRVQGNDGAMHSGEDKRLSPALANEVQAQMQTQSRSVAVDRADNSRGHERGVPAPAR